MKLRNLYVSQKMLEKMEENEGTVTATIHNFPAKANVHFREMYYRNPKTSFPERGHFYALIAEGRMIDGGERKADSTDAFGKDWMSYVNDMHVDWWVDLTELLNFGE